MEDDYLWPRSAIQASIASLVESSKALNAGNALNGLKS